MPRTNVIQALQHHPALSRPRRGCEASALAPVPPPRIATARTPRRPRRADGVHVLTISSIARPSRGPFARAAVVPYIRISGHWLARYGFAQGARIYVAGEAGKLVLTLDDPAQWVERVD